MTVYFGVGLFLVGALIGYVWNEFRAVRRLDDLGSDVRKVIQLTQGARDDIGVTSVAAIGLRKSLDSLANNVTILTDQNKKLQQEKLGREQLQKALAGEPSPESWRAL